MGKRRIKSKMVREAEKEIDYYHKLSPDEKKFLDQFMLEYYQGDMGFEKPIHTLKEHITECIRRKNTPQRDAMYSGRTLFYRGKERGDQIDDT